MFYEPIIWIWMFFAILNSASGEDCEVRAAITQLDTRPSSVAIKISTDDQHGPVSPYGLRIFMQCIQGPTVYPPVLFLAGYNSNDTIPIYRLSDGLFAGKKENRYCMEGDRWVIPERLDALSVSDNIYEVKYLQKDCTYNLSVRGHFHWDNMTSTCWHNLTKVTTESFNLPDMDKGYFWIKEDQTSLTQREVTILWSKAPGKAFIELYVGNELFPSWGEPIHLDKGYYTTSINMGRNKFQIRKLSYNETFIGKRKRLIQIPDHEEQLSTSSWSFKYTQPKSYEARLEWTMNKPQRKNVTEFIVYWFSEHDYSVPVAFVRISSHHKRISIESHFRKIPRIIGVGINSGYPYSSSGLQLVSMSEPIWKNDTQIDDTEHVEQAHEHIRKLEASPKIAPITPRYIAGDDTEHVEEPFQPYT